MGKRSAPNANAVANAIATNPAYSRNSIFAIIDIVAVMNRVTIRDADGFRMLTSNGRYFVFTPTDAMPTSGTMSMRALFMTSRRFEIMWANEDEKLLKCKENVIGWKAIAHKVPPDVHELIAGYLFGVKRCVLVNGPAELRRSKRLKR